jgi:hypothetical protein
MRSLTVFRYMLDAVAGRQRDAVHKAFGVLDAADEPFAPAEHAAWAPFAGAEPDPARLDFAAGPSATFGLFAMQHRVGAVVFVVDSNYRALAVRTDSVFPPSHGVVCALLRRFCSMGIFRQAPARLTVHYGLRQLASRVQCLLDGTHACRAVGSSLIATRSCAHSHGPPVRRGRCGARRTMGGFHAPNRRDARPHGH